MSFFFRRSGQLTSKSAISKFELIQAFIVVLVTCKNEKDPIKNEGDRVLTRFFPLCKSIGIFSDAQRQLTPQPLIDSGQNSNPSGI